jgi:hypothetical protein
LVLKTQRRVGEKVCFASESFLFFVLLQAQKKHEPKQKTTFEQTFKILKKVRAGKECVISG